MKAIGVLEFGGPDVLEVVELPVPAAGAGQVLVRVRFAAVNPTDATLRAGGRAAALEHRPPPYVPGMDFSGVVEALGPDGDGRFAVGDAVIGYVIPFATGGTYAEYIAVDADSVVHAPQGVPFAAASTLLLNALTADLALDALVPDEGGPVLVTGSLGAVGGYAVELAADRGLDVVVDAGEPGPHAEVVARGNGFADRVRAAHASGIANAIDAANLADALVPAISDDGAIASLKGWAGPASRGIRVLPISSFSAAHDTPRLERLRDAASAGTLTMRVADVLPMEHAAEAHRRLAAGGLLGRIVLDLHTERAG